MATTPPKASPIRLKLGLAAAAVPADTSSRSTSPGVATTPWITNHTTGSGEICHQVIRRRHWPRSSHPVELRVGRATAGNDYLVLTRDGRARRWLMKDVYGIVQKKTKGKRDGRLHFRISGYRRVRLDFPSAAACDEAADTMKDHRQHKAPTEISMLVCTWNMGNAMPQEDLAAWLSSNVDVYAVGVQEASYKMPKELQETYKTCADHWFAVASEACGPGLRRIGTASMGSIHLIVLCTERVAPFISDVENGSVPTGVGGVGTNKGGVALSFRVCSAHVCVVNSHLAAHEAEHFLRQRNANAADISQHMAVGRLGIASRRLDLAERFTHLFWCGDLNYRVELPRAAVLDRVRERDWASLVVRDQLRAQMAGGEAFAGFREGELDFAPTFKHVHGEGPKHNHVYAPVPAAAAPSERPAARRGSLGASAIRRGSVGKLMGELLGGGRKDERASDDSAAGAPPAGEGARGRSESGKDPRRRHRASVTWVAANVVQAAGKAMRGQPAMPKMGSGSSDEVRRSTATEARASARSDASPSAGGGTPVPAAAVRVELRAPARGAGSSPSVGAVEPSEGEGLGPLAGAAPTPRRGTAPPALPPYQQPEAREESDSVHTVAANYIRGHYTGVSRRSLHCEEVSRRQSERQNSDLASEAGEPPPAAGARADGAPLLFPLLCRAGDAGQEGGGAPSGSAAGGSCASCASCASSSAVSWADSDVVEGSLSAAMMEASAGAGGAPAATEPLPPLKPSASTVDAALAPLRPYEQSKLRVPSWCDRVLWRSWPGCEAHVAQHFYASAPTVCSSDHSPVHAAFRLRLGTTAVPSGALLIPELKLVLSELRAEHLPQADANGLADPYLEVRASYSHSKRTSAYQPRTLSPRWEGEVLELPVPFSRAWVESVDAAHLFVRVMDHDKYSRDDTLGCCVLSCAGLMLPTGEAVPGGRAFSAPISHCGVTAGTLHGRLHAHAPSGAHTARGHGHGPLRLMATVVGDAKSILKKSASNAHMMHAHAPAESASGSNSRFSRAFERRRSSAVSRRDAASVVDVTHEERHEPT